MGNIETMRKLSCILAVLSLWAAGAFAADTVLTWPANGPDTLLRFTVSKLHSISSVSGQNDYLGEAVAENLSAKAIPAASFYLYLLDKKGNRVGEGYFEITNLAAGQKAKVPVTVHGMGSFASMELKPQHLPTDEPMKVKMSLTSVPAGASVKVDSEASGATPQVLPMAPGKHVLEFSKEGYQSASTPVEIADNAMPGSVNVELNPLTLDTVVLRDGTVLLGNVVSVTGTGVSIREKGKTTTLARTRVARVVFSPGKAETGKPGTKKSANSSVGK